MPAPALIAFPPPAVRHNEAQLSSRVRNAPTFQQCRQRVRKRSEGETAQHGVDALGSDRQLLRVHAREEDPPPGPGLCSSTCAAKHGLGQVNTDRQTPSPDGVGGGHERGAGAAGHIDDPSAPGDPYAFNESSAEVTKEVRSDRPVGVCRPVKDTPQRRVVSVHSPMLTRSRPQATATGSCEGSPEARSPHPLRCKDPLLFGGAVGPGRSHWRRANSFPEGAVLTPHALPPTARRGRDRLGPLPRQRAEGPAAACAQDAMPSRDGGAGVLARWV